MLSFRPEMDIGRAKAFLQQVLNGPVSNVHAIEQGELSRVFSYTRLDEEFVIHFNSSGEGFAKEQYLYESFFSQDIPIPRIVEVGKANELFYSIAEKAPGRTIAGYSEIEIKQIVPDLVIQFAKINQISVDETKGYGWIQPSGDGLYDSWVEFLESFFQKEQSGFWKDWYMLFENSFLNREVFGNLYTIMIDLAKYSPKERYLVHGDFHLGNMLSDGRFVTGIVDWEMAMYGDFVFDLAAQHLWTPQLQFPQMVREAWASDGLDIPMFEERLLSALLFKGLDGLRFYAKKGDKDAYDKILSKLLALTK